MSGAIATTSIVARIAQPGDHTFAAYAASEAWDQPDENLVTVQTEAQP